MNTDNGVPGRGVAVEVDEVDLELELVEGEAVVGVMLDVILVETTRSEDVLEGMTTPDVDIEGTTTIVDELVLDRTVVDVELDAAIVLDEDLKVLEGATTTELLLEEAPLESVLVNESKTELVEVVVTTVGSTIDTNELAELVSVPILIELFGRLALY
ncbi:hypothetical protein BU23DRAFT_563081 [Bimuria novae-zelandiae CBS 107.79]|uniref:Uncharacterized protein n=1 Tax=Bimuria novae-zelandiae CBS 107.79 TaxID=1447943 RepID=A0A6A5W2J9_9PLEO|nr:hypothetical protein BU23DRAFT_563081 [Bimuria novae-zelandiae CBS 107.79]